MANDAIALSSNLFARGLGGSLAIAPIESIHASRGVYQLLLAGKERVARRTNFHVQIALLRRTRLKSLAARAGDCDFVIFRMNSGFHFSSYLTLLSSGRSDQTCHDTGRSYASSRSTVLR